MPMMSSLGGVGIQGYIHGASNRNRMVAEALSEFIRNQQFQIQLEEYRQQQEKNRKAQEDAQKKAQKKAKTQAWTTAGIGAGVGAATAGLGAALMAPEMAATAAIPAGTAATAGEMAAGSLPSAGLYGAGSGIGGIGAGSGATGALTAAEFSALDIGVGAGAKGALGAALRTPSGVAAGSGGVPAIPTMSRGKQIGLAALGGGMVGSGLPGTDVLGSNLLGQVQAYQDPYRAAAFQRTQINDYNDQQYREHQMRLSSEAARRSMEAHPLDMAAKEASIGAANARTDWYNKRLEGGGAGNGGTFEWLLEKSDLTEDEKKQLIAGRAHKMGSPTEHRIPGGEIKQMTDFDPQKPVSSFMTTMSTANKNYGTAGDVAMENLFAEPYRRARYSKSQGNASEQQVRGIFGSWIDDNMDNLVGGLGDFDDEDRSKMKKQLENAMWSWWYQRSGG